MTLFLLSLLIFLPRILLGAGLAHFLWRDVRPAALMLKTLAGIPFGLGICSSAMLFALKAGISPSAYAPLEAGLSLAAGAGFIISLWPRRWPQFRLEREDFPLLALMLLGLALSAGAFLFYSFRHPHGFGDAWTIWNNLPRYLYRSDDPGLLFRPQEYIRLHPDYPALTSLSIASAWALLRSDTTRAPMALAFLTTLASPIALGTALLLTKEKRLAVFAALTALMTPLLAMTVGQGADAALALTFLLAGVFLYLYTQNPAPGLLILAALLAGFAAWIKNEGLLFALLLTLSAAWLARRRLPWALAGLLFPLLVVVFFKANVAAQSDLARPLAETLTRLLDASRYTLIAANYLRELWNFGGWPLSQVIILAAFAVWRGLSAQNLRAAAPLWALILLQQGGYFFIYVITPHDLQLHLDTSLVRLLYQTYPLTLLALFLSLNDTGRAEALPQRRKVG
ncbi:MAG: hypothetical protein OHK0031_06520 [Anaerolineales bacterium]